MNYPDFLSSKCVLAPQCGLTVQDSDIHPMLFPFQRDLTRWAIRKGRAAILADTGLGKTIMQLEWARLISKGKPALIVAPLSVARQTIREAQRIALTVVYERAGQVHPLTITNYEMVEKFDPHDFTAVVLDESSILKAIDGKTRAKLTEMFSATPNRLCCSATPAPNDIAEIANHAEFLGIMSRPDMLATFFVHDDDGWRLKKHAEQPFYRWMASWGMSVRFPSDLGYEDDGFILPPLAVEPIFVKTELSPPDGELFWSGMKGIRDRSRVRQGTLQERCRTVAEMVNADSDQWILWHGLNQEGYELDSLIDDAALVEGSQTLEAKIAALEDFQDGGIRVLLTKPKIAGHGLNFQNCHKMAFVGLSDSWEAYYQCIRRCYRFGQAKPVKAYIVLSEVERPIYENVMRKEREAKEMSENLIEHIREFEKQEISTARMEFDYQTETEKAGDYTLMLGDSAERMKEITDGSVDLSVFSPPFISLYTYSPTERDIGNSKTEREFFGHFSYIVDELMRVTKPGRNCCVHVSQVPAMLVRDGYIGLKDFRGKTIEHFCDGGWIYHGEVCIDKDPQAQAIRTHSKALLFAQLRKDSSWLRPALADYILVFRKPGHNAAPIDPDIDNDTWIEWARPIWYGIQESDTLNVAEGRDEKDERHICPLQLGTIERCIRLWSNPGDLVCSPFAGIGSEGYMALKLGRRFVGIELKRSYYETMRKNIARALDVTAQCPLFAQESA